MASLSDGTMNIMEGILRHKSEPDGGNKTKVTNNYNSKSENIKYAYTSSVSQEDQHTPIEEINTTITEQKVQNTVNLEFDTIKDPFGSLAPRKLAKIASGVPVQDIRDTKHLGTEIKQKIGGILLALIVVVLLFFLIRNKQSAQYKGLASCLTVISVSFYCNFFYVLLRSRNLHRVQTVTKKHRDFGNIILAIEIKEFPCMPVMSMSELFALRGSSISSLALATFCFISAFISAAVCLHWIDLYQNGDESIRYYDKEYIEVYFMIPAAIAMAIVGNFDLNSQDVASMTLHYFGVSCMLISIIPYNLQSSWSVFSIILTIFTLIIFAIYIYFTSVLYPTEVKTSDYKDIEDIKIEVHQISVNCLFIEAIGCALVTFSVYLYIWNIKEIGRCK
eukprot:206828_1